MFREKCLDRKSCNKEQQDFKGMKRTKNKSFPPAVGFHGHELGITFKMQALRPKFFETPLKIDSFCCLKF